MSLATECPPNWQELKAKYEADIEALQETAEMATVEKEIAEEKLDSCQKELQEMRDLLVEATSQIDAIKSAQLIDKDKSINDDKEESNDTSTISRGLNESTVTVYQLQKLEEQNENMKQALIHMRDMSARDKKLLDELQAEHEELQEKCIDLEEKVLKFTDQVKIYEEQIDLSAQAQEMIERLTQDKVELGDRIKELCDELDGMEKLRDINDQILESARDNEVELTNELDKLRCQYASLSKTKRDLEDCLTSQERNLIKLREENQNLHQELLQVKGRCVESESIEMQKHQIENVEYKLTFSESKMAEKEAEITRYRRNLASMEEQMDSLVQMTKIQAGQIDELKLNSESLEGEISELKRMLKKKMEETSELTIRKEMVEKKLQTVQEDSDVKIIALNKKLEDIKNEYEEAFRRQEEDIDNLEIERRELREQLTRNSRTLDRSAMSANVSMVTAQDASFANASVLTRQTQLTQQQVLQSPVRQQRKQDSQQDLDLSFESNTAGSDEYVEQSMQQHKQHQRVERASIFDLVGESALEERIRDLKLSFDVVNKRNYELELKLAVDKLSAKNTPLLPVTSTNRVVGCEELVADSFNLNQVKDLTKRATILKREVRLAMINTCVATKSVSIAHNERRENFEQTKLALKYQSLINEAHKLLSNSQSHLHSQVNPNYALQSATRLMHSTPVK